MTIVNKPDFTLFASEAKTGEVETFPNLLRGWGVTLEQTAGKPPMEWFNALQQRTDHWLMYLSQRGIPAWDSRLTYPLFAVVQHAGKFYVAKKESYDQSPDTSQNVWMSMAAALDLPAGSLTEKGMLQLSNATNSDSETMAATPKAVKAAMDLAASSSVKSVNGKKGEVQLTAGDVGALAQTGGTVNGPLTVEGNKLSLKGNDRKHLGFHNQDGSVRMWLYKDKGGDGVHLNNGEDGGSDWVFNKNGHFYSPQALHAAGATYREDGNVHGPVWGGHLSGWIEKRIHESSAFWVDGNNWWRKDFRAGIEFITQGGFMEGNGSTIHRVNLHANVPNRLLHVSITTINFGQPIATWNHEVKDLSNERDGFEWFHGTQERKMYWMAVGY